MWAGVARRSSARQCSDRATQRATLDVWLLVKSTSDGRTGGRGGGAVAGRRGATPTHRRHHHGGGGGDGDRRRPGMRVAEPATRVATIWLSRLLAGYMQRSGVRPSVRLSVPSVDRCSSVRRVCCWAPRGNPVHIVEADASQTRQFCRGKSGPALGGTEYRLMPSACRLIVRAKLWNLQFRYLVSRAPMRRRSIVVV